MAVVLCVSQGTLRAQAPAEGEAPAGPDPHISMTARGTVELHVSDLPLSTVLRLLSLKGQRNIIASPNVRGTVTADLYDVTFEQALEAILAANGAGFRRVGNFIYVYTQKELADMEAAATGRPISRVFTLSYVSAADAERVLRNVLGEDAVIAVSAAATEGLDSNATEGGGQRFAEQDFIVVTAPPYRMREVADLIAAIDVRPKQILIEATILRAELTEENALGIDFTLVGGVDLELLGATSQALRGLSLGQLPQERFELFNSITQTDFASDVPSGGFTLGVIKDHVALFVRALQEVTDTVVVANPKVLALNKQKGQVIVGRRDGYLTTTVTETQAVQKVEFLETGTRLIFRPFVADDGFIRVELHPEDSVGFISAQGLPSEQTTEVTTNVLVRDGETILIGGLFREVTTTARSQVPVLGSLPLVGSLFRSQNDSTAREEVIILLTIQVVKDQDAYAEASWRHFEDVERLRVGLRRGLMATGRDRQAQVHYRQALDAVRDEDFAAARWHVKMALHNYPTFMPAIRLQERVSSQRSWWDEASAQRDFIYRLIAEDRGESLRMFGRPGASPEEPAPSTDDRP